MLRPLNNDENGKSDYLSVYQRRPFLNREGRASEIEFTESIWKSYVLHGH